MAKKETVYYRFVVHGIADVPESFWSMGFANELEVQEGYLINLTRGVTQSEADIRMAGHKTIAQVIGDIRVPRCRICGLEICRCKK